MIIWFTEQPSVFYGSTESTDNLPVLWIDTKVMEFLFISLW